MRVECHGLTDRGQVRSSNEDQFLIAELHRVLQVAQSSLQKPQNLFGAEGAHLWVVADGMGGHSGGQQASQLAVLTIERFMLDTFKWFFQLRGENLLTEFQEAVRSADARIFESAARHPELAGMGTTVTMAYAVGGQLYVVHAGDSRCYLYRRGQLHQLTLDHTLTQQLVQAGELSPAEAENSPFKNVITNAVGGSEPGVRVEVHKQSLQPEDSVLLCSDGLSNMVAPEDIAAVLGTARSPEAACRELVERANAAGGRDNITAIVARFLT
jgi:PPM family protein phosphatase